jgi:hypothetical protein
MLKGKAIEKITFRKGNQITSDYLLITFVVLR